MGPQTENIPSAGNWARFCGYGREVYRQRWSLSPAAQEGSEPCKGHHSSVGRPEWCWEMSRSQEQAGNQEQAGQHQWAYMPV